MKNAFPKKEKIRTKNEFRALYKKGKFYSGRFMQLFAFPRADSLRKIGFAFSRRVAPAVFRNRVRRLLRETYRLNKKNFVDGYNLLVRVKTPFKKPCLALIEKEFLRLARQAGILKSRDVSRETFND